MPRFTSFRDFVRAVRYHEHVADMVAADSPPDIGYACPVCEPPADGRFLLSLGLARNERLNSAPSSTYGTLTTQMASAEGRRLLPRVLAAGTYDTLPFMRPNAEEAQSAQAWNEEIQNAVRASGLMPMTIEAMRAGLRAISPQTSFNPSPQLEPETAPAVELQTYRRRPETRQGFRIDTAGWYDVPGVGIANLEPGFYVFSGPDSFETRNPVYFDEQYEIVGREDPATPPTPESTPVRYDRDFDL